MKKLSIAVCCLAAVLFTLPVLAQEKNEDVTEYKFDNDVVEGAIERPGGASVSVIKKPSTTSLVKVRTHFIPHMFKSVEDI